MKDVSYFISKAKNFTEKALNLLFPPQCLSCNALVERHGALCQTCWNNIVFITEPVCVRCGFPFEYGLGHEALCADCLREPPGFSQARTVFRYDEHSHRLILPLKFFDQTHAVPTYASWLARAGQPFLSQCEVIVPVPLHWRRLWQRKYNQAALLAAALSKLGGIPHLPDALIRTRHQPPQTGLSRAERLSNMRGVFAVNPKNPAAIAGRSVLLIDDVMTTGATINNCCRALFNARAKEVYVLTLARTLRGS